jgi:hypothetical protein
MVDGLCFCGRGVSIAGAETGVGHFKGVPAANERDNVECGVFALPKAVSVRYAGAHA